MTLRRDFLEVDGRQRISWKGRRRGYTGATKDDAKDGNNKDERKSGGTTEIVVVVVPSRILDASRIPQD